MEVLELKDVKAVPDIIHSYPDRVKSEATPLVIDNGNLNLLYHIVLYHETSVTDIDKQLFCRVVQLQSRMGYREGASVNI